MQFLDRNKDQKFFLYYASPLPHLPLQAPKNWVDYYRDKLGPEEPYLGDKGYYPNLTPKATYAAMISYLDEQVGEIVAKLKEMGVYENTFIVFSSDNGPTHIDEQADIHFFNSTGIFVNSKNTVKGNVNEGGIRVPTIATWPDKINGGRLSDHPSTFYDYYATVCEILGVKPPYPIDGISYYPSLIEKPQKKHDYLYWEFSTQSGQQAVRYGKWKGIKTDLQKGPQPLQLFNLEDDIKEIKNVSDDNPMIVKKIESILLKARTTPALETFKIKAVDN